MGKISLKSFGIDPYLYIENTNNQPIVAVVGIDSDPTGLFTISTSLTPGTNPNDTGNRNFTIDPNPGGAINITANGAIKLNSPVVFAGGATYSGNITTDNAAVSAAANSLIFQKDRAGAVIVTGDALGQVYFQGYDGTSYVTGASITSTSSGTIAANRVAANLVFSTHPDSASGLTPTTALTIGPTGALTAANLNAAGVVQSSSAGLLSTSNGTNGQVLVGGGAAPAWAAITAGAGISVTNGANTITVTATGAGFTWNTVAGTSASMAVENAYIPNNAGLVTLTLPVTAAVGDSIVVTGKGAGGWRIAQNAGQTIYFGTATSTTGATGHIDSTLARDTVEIVCVTANNDFNVIYSIGNITVV